MSSLGSSKINGPLIANGGASFSNDNFVININTGDTEIKGTVNMYENLTIQKDLYLQGNFNVSSGMFTIQEVTGNTYIAGELTINKELTIRNTLSLINSNQDTIVQFNTSGFSYVLGGNLGIGTIEPKFKLHVNGNINVSKDNMYKIDGVDVVFSQWENINGDTDISFPVGKVFIGMLNPPTISESILTVSGNLTIADSGNLFIYNDTLENYIKRFIPKSVWDNHPDGSTVENEKIKSISTNYNVQIAETLSVGGDINSKYKLNIYGDLNIKSGNIYFDDKLFDYNLWRTSTINQGTGNTQEKTIYFTTTDTDLRTPGVNYVGIGTKHPGYHLDVNGHVNVRGNLSINGVAVVFPSREDGSLATSTWMESNETEDGKVSLFYKGGNVGIGTESPESLLTIQGDTNSTSELFHMIGKSYTSFIQFSRTTNTSTLEACKLGFTENDDTLNIMNQLGSGSIALKGSTGGLLNMNSSGNVGIGTTNTTYNNNDYKLYVTGKIFTNDNISITGTDINITNSTAVDNTTDSEIRPALRHAINDTLQINPDKKYKGGVEISGAFYIIPHEESSNYYIGINASKPGYSLDVDGDINYSGNLRRDGALQQPSQWSTENIGAANEYIHYPSKSLNIGDQANVGIGTSAQPEARLEVLDPTVSNAFDYFPQLMLTSAIDDYGGSNQGTTIELNTISSSDLTRHKGIRLHTVDESNDASKKYTGFAIDTASGDDADPFTNIFYINKSGNLGLGNFLDNTAMQIPRAKLHILNATTTQPALIISDNSFPTQPGSNVSDLNFMCSGSDANNLGYFSKIIGLNVKPAIGANNTLLQNATSEHAQGAIAINLSAGGGNGGTNTGTAMGVLFTDENGSEGDTLKEKFTISYEGNIGIRTTKPSYGISVTHSENDTHADTLYTGSINIDGYYYQNGTRLHLPWLYWKSDDGTYGEPAGGFPVFYYNDTTWQPKNNIHQIDSVVGIGTAQPRGALDVLGTLYSSYTTLSSRKVNHKWLSLYHSNYEATEPDTSSNNPQHFAYIMKDNGQTIINSLITANGGNLGEGAISFQSFGKNKVYAEIINEATAFESTFFMYGHCQVSHDMYVKANLYITGYTYLYSNVSIGGYLTVAGTLKVTGGTTFSSDIHVEPHNVYANAFYASSDLRLKENILPIDNALEKVNQMQGVYFNMKTDKSNKMIGLIAQDVEKIIPEVVKENDDEDKTKTISYSNITAVLIEAVKELTQQNKELQKRIEILENK